MLRKHPLVNFVELVENYDNILRQENNVSNIPADAHFNKEGDFVAYINLPGIKKKDINIEANKNLLTISCERVYNENEDIDYRVCQETFYGKAQRTFKLPFLIEDRHVIAKMEDGIITVHIKRPEESQHASKIHIA